MRKKGSSYELSSLVSLVYVEVNSLWVTEKNSGAEKDEENSWNKLV